VAKYENTWDQYPHLVCLGAEKNFIRYTSLLVDHGYPQVDEEYFRRLVAKTILFRAAEKLVGAQKFGGFRAQIVAYALAWLSHSSAQRIDLERIWNEQGVNDGLSAAIVTVSGKANEHIINPPPNRRNPGEWCKREECWDAFRVRAIRLSHKWAEELVDTTGPAKRGRTTSGMGAPGDDPETTEVIERIMEVSADTWFQISRWAKETGNLLPWQRGLAFSLGRLAKLQKRPSAKQAVQAVKIVGEAQRKGFKAETAEE
jgi:hypothetical protein